MAINNNHHAPLPPANNEEDDVVPPKTLSRGVIKAYRGVMERVLPAFAASLQLDALDGLSEGESEAAAQRLKVLWLKAMKQRFGVDLGTVIMSDAPLPVVEQRVRKKERK